ncbi:MAG: flagellar basal-body MS-ring/collar protein FliF, partial [Porticoccaceae bacterium]|nr:flagellar basal-body MS-ring/collar protein FliF [Porticoccaceae bacterium]
PPAGQAGGAPADSSGLSIAGVQGVMSQPAVKKSLPAIMALLTLAVFIIAYSWVQQPPYKALYSGLSEADKQAAYEALAAADYRATIDSKTGELKVPDARYHEARIFLASKGLPQSGTVGGIASLSDDASMTTSQFMEQVRYVSAMESELARSISQLATIQSARVHLASPKQSVFVRNRTPAKASAVVTPFPGRIVSASQVQAIVHMIASSVPYLAAEDVSVVDQRGKLLTDVNRLAASSHNAEQIEHKQRIEESYRSRIDAFLSQVVGTGNVRSEVDVLIDFTEIESTYEEYDGNNNGLRARSEILIEEKGGAGKAGGIPGATSNAAPLDATAVIDGQIVSQEGLDSSGLDTLSSKTTRNYEMDRAVRHVKRQGGKLERLSVAVVLNTPTASDEETLVEAYSEQEIDRFTDLVKGVVGFNAARGDVVTIVSTKFEPAAPILAPQVLWYENPQAVSIIKSALAALLALALLFFVVRPTIQSYTGKANKAGEDGNNNFDTFAANSQEAMNGMNIGAEGQRKTDQDVSMFDAKRRLENRTTISPEFMNEARSYDDKVALVRLLVAKEPERVANVFKKMIK